MIKTSPSEVWFTRSLPERGRPWGQLQNLANGLTWSIGCIRPSKSPAPLVPRSGMDKAARFQHTRATHIRSRQKSTIIGGKLLHTAPNRVFVPSYRGWGAGFGCVVNPGFSKQTSYDCSTGALHPAVAVAFTVAIHRTRSPFAFVSVKRKSAA